MAMTTTTVGVNARPLSPPLYMMPIQPIAPGQPWYAPLVQLYGPQWTPAAAPGLTTTWRFDADGDAYADGDTPVPRAAKQLKRPPSPPVPSVPRKRPRDPTPAQLMVQRLMAPPTKGRRWTDEEHDEFVAAVNRFGKRWKTVAEHVPTKTAAQVRTHASSYFSRLRQDLADPALVLLQLAAASPLKCDWSVAHLPPCRPVLHVT